MKIILQVLIHYFLKKIKQQQYYKVRNRTKSHRAGGDFFGDIIIYRQFIVGFWVKIAKILHFP